MQATFASLLSFLLLATHVVNGAILPSANDLDDDYDYVIVGGMFSFFFSPIHNPTLF